MKMIEDIGNLPVLKYIYPHGLPILRWVCTIALITYVVKYKRQLYCIIVKLPRDFKFVYRWTSLILKTWNFERDNVTVVSIFNSRVIKHPNAVCFIHEENIWTNEEINEYSNRIANAFHERGYAHGDVIAICLENRPEYVAIWLGFAKLGVISALINTNLIKEPLAHVIKVAKPKGIIAGEQYRQAFLDIHVQNTIELYVFRPKENEDKEDLSTVSALISLNTIMVNARSTSPEVNHTIRNRDILFYIYTSGTTGMPKAAIVPHARYLIVSMATTTIISLYDTDIMYNPLPLYHSAGGIIGTGPALLEGITVVIKTKFSASNYFSDCAKYNCSIGQYIGEMCRYILATPDNVSDKKHKVRMVIGNGLSPTIWPDFVKRFAMPQVTELYGATEGNVNIVNLDSTVGAVGFLPRFIPAWISGIGIIKMDQDTAQPLRDAQGLCILSDINEPGMFVGIISKMNAAREFHGYVDEEATNEKVISNVFRKDDKAFISGDTMVMDEYGYLYFKDRTGDTYRWKGENVATAEVEAAISRIASLQDATVYGVIIPGQEGRAGMAAIADPTDRLDIRALAEGFDQTLPIYARPILLRIMQGIDMTGTYRMKKYQLQKEGFNPEVIKDQIYFRSGDTYKPLTPDLYKAIINHQIRI